jgi:GrpB-like predicted nucleotidyltransferase (UPF0157 family)
MSRLSRKTIVGVTNPTPTGPPRRNPTDEAAYDTELARRTIGPPRPLTSPIEIADYDPGWPRLYEREAARIRSILGPRVVRIEHAGSTSVPRLPAKPIIDIVLEVPDSSDEAAYVPDMEAAGYVLRIREPDWFEHRLFHGPDTNLNLHTFSARCSEVERMLTFRDWLRINAADRELYKRTKRELAANDWKYMQQYADAKTAVVEEILARASRGADFRR